MTANAGVVDFKSEKTEEQVAIPTDISIRPHIVYLEFLKKNGLLGKAIEGTLPKDVERAAKLAVASDLVKKHGKEKVRVFKSPDGEIAIAVDAIGKELEQAEVNDFINHYRMENFIRSVDFALSVREITKGSKYEIKSGYFFNRCVLVKGLDREIFGVDWHENFNNPLCEKHIFRVQRDGLPMRGRVFVCKLLDEKRDVLIHESEIGLHIL